jgi:type IV pilus assembly protein PilV
MAQYDLHQWKTALARMLPAGDGKIDTVDSETAAPAKDVTITIHWDEFRTGATGTNCPPVSEADMACFEFRVTL